MAIKTNDVAGDGTTTAALVLAQKIVSEGPKNVAAGANPVTLWGGIEKALDAAAGSIREQAREISGRDGISRVGAISTRSEEIGGVIADATARVGKEGVANVEQGQTLGMEFEFPEGMQFDRGYISPYFVIDEETMEAVLDEPYILMASQKIGNVPDLLPVLNAVVGAGKPLLIIPDDLQGGALAALIINVVRGTFSAAAGRALSFGRSLRRRRRLRRGLGGRCRSI